MKVSLVIALVWVSCSAVLADLPMLQLDGTYSKSKPHQDDYPYTPLDYEKAQANPLGLEVARKLTGQEPDYETLRKRLEDYPYGGTDAAMRATYVTTVEREYELTAKEKEVVKNNPWEFPEETERGKRVARAEVLKLGGKEYNFNSCHFRGAEDLNQDGLKELVLDWFEPVTHAGGASELRVIDENGRFVWSRSCDGRQGESGSSVLLDVDGDGRKELVLMLHGRPSSPGAESRRELQIMKCSPGGAKVVPEGTGGQGPRPALGLSAPAQPGVPR